MKRVLLALVLMAGLMTSVGARAHNDVVEGCVAVGPSSCTYEAHEFGSIAAVGSWRVEIFNGGPCIGTPTRTRSTNNVEDVAGLWENSISPPACVIAHALDAGSVVAVGNVAGIPPFCAPTGDCVDPNDPVPDDVEDCAADPAACGDDNLPPEGDCALPDPTTCVPDDTVPPCTAEPVTCIPPDTIPEDLDCADPDPLNCLPDDVPPCTADPVTCVPPLPEDLDCADPDPTNCLPDDVPPPCTANPVTCVPPLPEDLDCADPDPLNCLPDDVPPPCTANPETCIPPDTIPEDLDCADPDPTNCLPDDVPPDVDPVSGTQCTPGNEACADFFVALVSGFVEVCTADGCAVVDITEDQALAFACIGTPAGIYCGFAHVIPGTGFFILRLFTGDTVTCTIVEVGPGGPAGPPRLDCITI